MREKFGDETACALPISEERANLAKEMCRFVTGDYIVLPVVYADTTFLVNDDTVGGWPAIPRVRISLNLEDISHPTPLGTFRLFES